MATAARRQRRGDSTDLAFRALADAGRRQLLDRLFARDGQRLLDLQETLAVSRFGVMKHLRVLEEAGLITTRKVGREKMHYLNPVPIRMIYDRWVSKYAEPFAAALTRLKEDLETEREPRRIAMKTVTAPKHVLEVYIQTTPVRLWQALTDPAFTQQYYFNGRVHSDWKPGSAYEFLNPNGGIDIQGKVLEADPPRRLVTTFHAEWDPEVKKDPPSTVTFEIEPQGDACLLRLIHTDLEEGSATQHQVVGGWPMITSSLKTLLETGKPLNLPQSSG